DDRAWLLRRGAGIEVSQAFSPDRTRQYGEIAGQVQSSFKYGFADSCIHETSASSLPSGNRLRTVEATRRRMGSRAMRCKAWAAKAYVNTPRACASDKPRERR